MGGRIPWQGQMMTEESLTLKLPVLSGSCWLARRPRAELRATPGGSWTKVQLASFLFMLSNGNSALLIISG